MISLILKDFKYLNLTKSVFYMLKYEKHLFHLLINSNYKTIVSFLLQEINNNISDLNKNKFRFFLFSDLMRDVSSLADNTSMNAACDVRISKIIRIYLFFFIQLQLNKKNNFKIVSLPNKKQIFTLLRSPHTDKKSREQFRKLEFKKLIKGITFFSNSFVNFLVKKEHVTSKIRSKYVGK